MGLGLLIKLFMLVTSNGVTLSLILATGKLKVVVIAVVRLGQIHDHQILLSPLSASPTSQIHDQLQFKSTTVHPFTSPARIEILTNISSVVRSPSNPTSFSTCTGGDVLFKSIIFSSLRRCFILTWDLVGSHRDSRVFWFDRTYSTRAFISKFDGTISS